MEKSSLNPASYLSLNEFFHRSTEGWHLKSQQHKNVYLFLYLFLFFNLFLIGGWLQYCVGFCHTSTWITHRYIYIYIPSLLTSPPTSHPIPPFKVVTEHWTWVPCFIQLIPTDPLLYIWWCMCFNATLSICLTLSFTHLVHKSTLYACIAFAALQIVSSVPSF